MDPALDPPPPAALPTAALSATAVAAANPTPTQSPALNHPPYSEMITSAVAALNEREGSSKRAIAKYIETHYSSLPPTHSALLTHHLKRLKANGQLLMVKYSYKLPGSAPAAANNGAVDPVASDPASSVAKRRPGRPPKPKPDAVQAAVPVFAPPANVNPVVPGVYQTENLNMGPGTGNVAVGGVNGPPVTPVRGRGRPPKQAGVKRGRGRPPSSGASVGGVAGGGGSGRGRGRPKRNVVPLPPREKGPGRPRGRPPKPINVVEGFASAAPVGGVVGTVPVAAVPVGGGGGGPGMRKRRGRPPKAGSVAKKPRIVQPRKPRKLSGKPLGRPKKDASSAIVSRTPDSQLLVAYLDLKAKLENLQSRVKQTTTFVRPFLNHEAAINAVQELELLAMNVNNPPNAQNQQPQQELPPSPPAPAPAPAPALQTQPLI